MEENLLQVKLNKKIQINNENHAFDDGEHNADDDDDNDSIMEEEDEADLTNLAWLTELRNQRHRAWHNGLKNLGKTTAMTTNKFLNENNVYDEHDYDYADNDNISITTTTATTTTTTTTTTISTSTTDQLNSKTNKKYTNASISSKYHNNEIKPISKCQFQQQQQAHLENIQKRPIIKRPTPMERFEIFCKKIKRDFEEYEKNAEHYQSVGNEKPPFNYSHIIGMAMLEKGRVTLQQICSWIEYKFAYFRLRKKWNNSIRHNLSLHPCFRKIERKKYEKGKGGYWELGIDLKKCDRKRIRHRKSNSLQQLKQKQQQIEQQEIVPTQNNNNNNNEDDENVCHEIIVEQEEGEEEELELAGHDVGIELADVDDEERKTEKMALNKICMNLVASEKDLLIDDDDDLDVQHNVDITSSPSYASCLHYNNNEHHFIEEHQQHQEYKLGTIIISTTTATRAPPTNLQDDDKEGKNSTIANNNMLTDTTTTLNSFIGMPQQQSNIIQDLFINQTEGGNNNIIIDTENNGGHQQQHQPHRGPNVIVEEIQQHEQQEHYSLINNYHVATLLSPLNYNNNNIRNINTTVNNNNNNNDNNSNIFQTAEIDSIEEAFQYLRSIDHYNREDTLLDHLFDVSVSDF